MAGLLALLGIGVTLGTLTFTYYGLVPVFFWVLFSPLFLYSFFCTEWFSALVSIVPILGLSLSKLFGALAGKEDYETETLKCCILSMSFSMASGWSARSLFSYGDAGLQLLQRPEGDSGVFWQVATGVCVLGAIWFAAVAIRRWRETKP